jgi:peroxiredoxin
VSPQMSKVEIGDVLRPRQLTAILSECVDLPDRGRLVHLQFRRYAGCPVCNLHLRSVARRHEEIVAAGIREIVVFHSSAEALEPHQGEMPFAVIPDPERGLYVEFGVERSRRALLDPRAWWAEFRGALRRRNPLPTDGESINGLPADFLIDTDGRVVARKYGVHANDQWSVDELLGLAAAASRRPWPGSFAVNATTPGKD